MYEAFLIIGLILIAGFLANAIFERTRVSQVLILIALGFLLGPASGVIDAQENPVLSGITPFVGILALIILLFDGGITLNVFSLVKVLPKATAFTLIVFILSVAATAALAVFWLGWGCFTDSFWGLQSGAPARR